MGRKPYDRTTVGEIRLPTAYRTQYILSANLTSITNSSDVSYQAPELSRPQSLFLETFLSLLNKAVLTWQSWGPWKETVSEEALGAAGMLTRLFHEQRTSYKAALTL